MVSTLRSAPAFAISDGRQSSCHSLRLTLQKIATALVAVKKERISIYVKGVNAALDKAIGKAVGSVNVPLIDSLSPDNGQPRAVDLLTWYNNAIGGHPQLIDELREIHVSYVTTIESLNAAMAVERATRYQDFMKRPISHNNCQAIHRILKKKPSQMARPVPKDKMDTRSAPR